jgi:hypothetical protein
MKHYALTNANYYQLVSIQAVHLVNLDHQQQVFNLTDACLWILRFLGSACQNII